MNRHILAWPLKPRRERQSRIIWGWLLSHEKNIRIVLHIFCACRLISLCRLFLSFPIYSRRTLASWRFYYCEYHRRMAYSVAAPVDCNPVFNSNRTVALQSFPSDDFLVDKKQTNRLDFNRRINRFTIGAFLHCQRQENQFLEKNYAFWRIII